MEAIEGRYCIISYCRMACYLITRAFSDRSSLRGVVVVVGWFILLVVIDCVGFEKLNGLESEIRLSLGIPPTRRYFSCLCRQIKGCYWYTNGAVYEGEYRNGRVHGKGRATFPSGDSYAGEWKDGAMSGHGVYDFKAEGARWGHV